MPSLVESHHAPWRQQSGVSNQGAGYKEWGVWLQGVFLKKHGERYARGRMGYHPWMDVGHGPHDAPSPQTCCDERRADGSCQRGCQAGGKGACWRTGPGREWDRLHFAGDCPRLSRLPADKPLQRLVFWNGLNTIRCGNVREQPLAATSLNLSPALRVAF